ncbi:MAG: hypothetical protein JJU29_11105 [Verrucomicrobia bacterium]|nr:hypothetical protein [Verrucomicrobiota bacterium]
MKTQHTRLLLILLLLAGAASRIFGAWASRYITDADSSVVALMAQHMAEGREWPVFFYGQDYMGSLEPMASALMVFLLGPTGFAVCLGPALVAVAALWALWLWAKDAGGSDAGPLTGLVALALCVVGPARYFFFQFDPRGGYMVALLFGAFLLWKSARMSVALWEGQHPSISGFLTLGLVAGLGLWAHTILASAVMAAAVLLCIGFRGAFWRQPKALLAGVVGGVVGLAPFLIYNASRGWPSLSMLESTSGLKWTHGLHWFWQRWLRLVDLPNWPDFARLLVAVGYFLLAGLGLVFVLLDLRKRRLWDRPTAARASALLFLLFSVIIFARSQFATLNTSRYLVPLVPPLALFAALGISLAPKAVLRRAGGIVALLLIVSQLAVFPSLWDLHRMVPQRLEGEQALAEALDAENITLLYAALNAYPLNFTLKEQYVFTDSHKAFYEPHFEALEFTDSPAFLKNHAGIGAFLRVAGGSARHGGPPGSDFHFDFSPPTLQLVPVPSSEWGEVVFNGHPAPGLRDLNINPQPEPDPERRDHEITFHFDQPQALQRLRLLFATRRPPDAWNLPHEFSVEIRETIDGEWLPVLPRQPATRLFWSGPRPYNAGRGERMELQLEGREALGVRLQFHDRHVPQWQLLEIAAFVPSDQTLPSESESLSELLDLLEAQNVRNLYADRWVSNRVHLERGETLNVSLTPMRSRSGGLPGDGTVYLREHTAFLSKTFEAEDTRAILGRANWAYETQTIGPWVLFLCEKPPQATENPELHWTGYGLRRKTAP